MLFPDKFTPPPDRDMSLSEHLQELRTCLLKSLAALLFGSLISLCFIQDIVSLLTAAAGNLYYMRPAEAFLIYMKLTVFCGLLLALPVILRQLYIFISPALTAGERRFLLLSLPVMLLAACGGMLFAYFFVFPRGLEFFLSFADSRITPLLSLESYLGFMLMLVAPFALIFNIPLAVLLLGRCGIISTAALTRYRKHVILGGFILAAILTPTPDIVTQCLLAIPIAVLYEISIICLKFFSKGESNHEQTQFS